MSRTAIRRSGASPSEPPQFDTGCPHHLPALRKVLRCQLEAAPGRADSLS
ncbi:MULTISPECIES: hypothetical protein [unclassified Pseudomonas]|nr:MULTISPECIES: hypothetical protein [unclassified Pseudomonas]QIH06754.1 hypothetical protein ATY02_08555 [Pseudomonas sp. BIOMIG1BAC]UMZ13501.1 hypothetical protein I9018_07315 [Pseudomonas sp. MPFS]